MTQRTRDAMKRVGWWMSIAIPALAGAWGMAKEVGGVKLDVSRFEKDSAVFMAHDSAWKDGVSGALHDLKQSVDSVNLRLRQITCGARVETGCR